MHRPRLILSGLNGGAGKTILSLGLCRAWTRAGHSVQPFKKGPDYIDAVWLGLAARKPASNLDPFLMPPERLTALFRDRSQRGDLSVIEGNRGLFDGKDLLGSCSTAEVARLLQAPVLLALDCTKMTRTAAAIVSGCQQFEPNLNLAGVILNRTASDRHRAILTSTIEHYTGLPVLGALPKLPDNPIPERQMGLVSSREYGGHEVILDELADIAERHLDLERVLDIARAAPPLPESCDAPPLWPKASGRGTVLIGYVRDAALWFYYEENLEALRQAGAELVELSLLSDAPWPELNGLYLGGGFPETQAKALAQHASVRQRVRMLAESGLPVYAECGGFMYLGEAIVCDGVSYPMAGVFPVHTTIKNTPQGLGYVQSTVAHANPFFSLGQTIQGHEFHYSDCLPADGAVLTLALKLERGSGLLAGYDGLVYKNTFAAYVHIHALGVQEWAPNFVEAARRQRDGCRAAFL